MKLYEVPRGSRIYVDSTDGSRWITFHRIDGMYSTCTTENGTLVHLGACCPLVAYEDGFKIEENK